MGLLIFLAPTIRQQQQQHRREFEESLALAQSLADLDEFQQQPSTSSGSSSSGGVRIAERKNRRRRRNRHRQYQQVIFRDDGSGDDLDDSDGDEQNQNPTQRQPQEDLVEDIEEVAGEDEADLVALVPIGDGEDEDEDEDGQEGEDNADEDDEEDEEEAVIDDGELLMADEHDQQQNPQAILDRYHQHDRRHRRFHFRFLRNKQQQDVEHPDEQQKPTRKESTSSCCSSSALSTEKMIQKKKTSSILLKIPNFLRTNLFNSIFTANNSTMDSNRNSANDGAAGSTSSSNSSINEQHSLAGCESSNALYYSMNNNQTELKQCSQFSSGQQSRKYVGQRIINEHFYYYFYQQQPNLKQIRILPKTNSIERMNANDNQDSSSDSYYSIDDSDQLNHSVEASSSDRQSLNCWSYGRSNLLSYYLVSNQNNKEQQRQSSIFPLYKHQTFRFELLDKNGLQDDLRPLSRSGHRIVSNRHYVYLFGGFNPHVPSSAPVPDERQWCHSKPLFKELWRYSKLTQIWQYLPTFGSVPMELASHCAVMIDEKHLLVYGGSGIPFGAANSNKMYICDLERLHWHQIVYENETTVADDPTQLNPDIPEPAYGQAISYDSKAKLLYICGGTSGLDYSLNLHVFSMENKRWRRLSSTPENIEPRYRHEMVLYDNKLFIIGGGTSDQSFSMEKIPVFDLATENWTLQPAKPWKAGGLNSDGEFPPPRYSHDIGQMGRKIYMVGGADQQRAFDDTWSLDLVTLQWTKHVESSLPAPSYFHSATISPEDGEMFVFGGVNSISQKRRNNEMYRCWFGVPTLQRMAQEAVKRYVQNNLQMLNHKTCLHPKRSKNITANLKHLLEYFDCMSINYQMLNLPEF